MSGKSILKGKNAVVLCAGGSIGAVVAKEFAMEGAEVFLAGRTKATVEAVIDQPLSQKIHSVGLTLLGWKSRI